MYDIFGRNWRDRNRRTRQPEIRCSPTWNSSREIAAQNSIRFQLLSFKPRGCLYDLHVSVCRSGVCLTMLTSKTHFLEIFSIFLTLSLSHSITLSSAFEFSFSVPSNSFPTLISPSNPICTLLRIETPIVRVQYQIYIKKKPNFNSILVFTAC